VKYFGLGFFTITLLAIGSDAFALTDAELQANDDRLWLLIFIIGLMFSFGLGAVKGGQR
jgi:hypothetical protein